MPSVSTFTCRHCGRENHVLSITDKTIEVVDYYPEIHEITNGYSPWEVDTKCVDCGVEVVVFLAVSGVELERDDPNRPGLFRRIYEFFGGKREEAVVEGDGESDDEIGAIPSEVRGDG